MWIRRHRRPAAAVCRWPDLCTEHHDGGVSEFLRPPLALPSLVLGITCVLHAGHNYWR